MRKRRPHLFTFTSFNPRPRAGGDTEFEMIDALFDENGSHPLAMLIGEGLSADNKWSGFFHIDEPPSADYGYPSHTDCSMTIKEAV